MTSLGSLLKSSVSVGVISLALSTVINDASAHGALPSRGHFTAGQGNIAKFGGLLTVDQSSQTGIIDWKSFSVSKQNNIVFDNGGGATLNIVRSGDLSRIAGSLRGTGSVYLINRAGVMITGTSHIDTSGGFAASSRDADETEFSRNKHLRLTGNAKGDVVDAGEITARRNVTLVGLTTVVRGAISTRNVETSGNSVRLLGVAIRAKNWLIDPTNLTITSSAARSIDASLNYGTDVTLETSKSGAHGPGRKGDGPGDIIVANTLMWKSDASLTLSAYRNIKFDRDISISNKKTGSLLLRADNSGIGRGAVLFLDNDKLNWTDSSGTISLLYNPNDNPVNSTINKKSYTEPADYAKFVAANSIKRQFMAYMLVNTADDLQNVRNNLSGDYALGRDVKVSSIANFIPLGDVSAAFTGVFDGLGHTIADLNIVSKQSDVALFGNVDKRGILRNINLVHVSVSTERGTSGEVGGLVGYNQGSLDNVHVAGSISSTKNGKSTVGVAIGGLVGENIGGTISQSSSSANVSNARAYAPSTIGGLVGYSSGLIEDSYATGTVDGEFKTGGSGTGGLLGENSGGSVLRSYSTSIVKDASTDVGGLVGINDGFSKILFSWAKGAVIGDEHTGEAGGLVGENIQSLVKFSYATGNVSCGGWCGGLVGYNEDVMINSRDEPAKIIDCYATGNVDAWAGGLVGANDGNILRSYSTGRVGNNGLGDSGFIANNSGYVSESYWDTDTSEVTDSGAGGDSSGIRGLTTVQLQSALPKGFNSSIWGLDPNINGGFPYLKALIASY